MGWPTGGFQSAIEGCSCFWGLEGHYWMGDKHYGNDVPSFTGVGAQDAQIMDDVEQATHLPYLQGKQYQGRWALQERHRF